MPPDLENKKGRWVDVDYMSIIIENTLRTYLEEDIGYGDITSVFLRDGDEGNATVRAKKGGIISGIDVCAVICKIADLKFSPFKNDGISLQAGETVFGISGKIGNILAVERTMLNILTRMSAIATTTRKYVNLVKKCGYNVRIAASRKTTPGFRYFEKKAVMDGGGDPHRWRLDDMVLIKNRHLSLIDDRKSGIGELIGRIRNTVSFTKKIEIEVESAADAVVAAEAGADIIMFDNMTPGEITKAIGMIRKMPINHNPLFEASGNITYKNLEEYAATGVHIISTSAITMFPEPGPDFTLELSI